MSATPLPHAGPGRRPDPLATRRRLVVTQMAHRLAQAARAAEVTRVLLVSVESGDGRTRLAESLDTISRNDDGPSLLVVRPEAIASGVTPDDVLPTLAPGQLLLVDGPPWKVHGASLGLPLAWREMLEASLVVAASRRTLRPDLEAMGAWLRAVGLPPLGVVINEHQAPPLATVGMRARRCLALPFVARRLRREAQLVAASPASPSGAVNPSEEPPA